MSKKLEVEITCPGCKKPFNAEVFRSIWVEFPENLDLILNYKINYVTCPACGLAGNLPFAFLATNSVKQVAVWFEPFPDPQVDEDARQYAQHLGPDNFFAKAPRIRDWKEFKNTLVRLNAGPVVPTTPADLATAARAMRKLPT